MSRYYFLLVFFTLPVFLYGQPVPHVVLSFDDSYIDEWFAYKELFNTYNIKATFFISRPQLLTISQIDKLKHLVAEGHEIGCHGMNHIEVTEENQYQYIETEVVPALQLMSDYGFTVSSYAYPFGTSTPYLDSTLTNYFTFIRKANYNYLDTLISIYSNIFAYKSKFCVTDAMGIDGNYHISMDNLEDAIINAYETSKYLVLYAHAINNSGENYSITPQYLEDFFILMKKHRIGAVTCREIVIR
jgi:hypothetical protein